MTYYRFEEISLTASKSGDCAICGKKAKRSRKFTNTVNPFNKNADGTVRAREEVKECVGGLVRDWEEAPVVHAGCEDSK